MLSANTHVTFEPARRIVGATIAWADRDYFRDRMGYAPSDDELVRRFALMSEAHLAPNEVNSPFDVADDVVPVRRPPAYGRVVITSTEWGEYDVKGAGVGHNIRPSLAQHANGLLTFPAAIAEVCTERLARRALAAEGAETAKCVALILLPIYLRNPLCHSGETRCALLVRESFPRVHANPEDEEPAFALLEFSMLCERALRRFGLTTTSSSTNVSLFRENSIVVARVDKAPVPPVVAEAIWDLTTNCPYVALGELDTLNVQLCLNLSRQKLLMVDFGSVEFRPTFDKPMLAAYLSLSSNARVRQIRSLQANQRAAQMDGYACVLAAQPPFAPAQVYSSVARLLEMTPLHDDDTDFGARARTKCLAKIARVEVERARTEQEVCTWTTTTIQRFSL
jgi:hypothetical protein